MVVKFARRAKVRRSELTTHRTYPSKCGSFTITEVRWNRPDAYGCYWLACGNDGRLFSRHRTRKAAEAAVVEFLAKRGAGR
jgi:hypothetical protein